MRSSSLVSSLASSIRASSTILAVTLVWFGALGGVLRAQTAPGTNDVQLNVVEPTLPNGMRILMVERHDSPTVGLYLLFKVGGVDDPEGRTGIAHMLEHMMFKGTRTYGTTDYNAEVPMMEQIDRIYTELAAELRKQSSPLETADEAKIERLRREMAEVQQEQRKYVITDEFWETNQRIGGVGLNASTGADSTQYFVQLPSNQLEVWAYLESDRLANPVFREFYAERDVVHEERRMRTDTRPENLLWESFQAAAFVAHPYRNPVIGWPSDIAHLTREEVLQYFKTYYAPNNAIVAIVGDIDPDKTYALLEKYFGPIPPQPIPPRNIPDEPEPRGERRVIVEADAQPRVYVGWLTPRIGHPDGFALDVLAQVWTGSGRGSRTGRLYKSLVLDRKLALNVDAGNNTSLYPNLFLVTATPAEGKSVASSNRRSTRRWPRSRRSLPRTMS
jgi:predicted Zn-dependent peptidase